MNAHFSRKLSHLTFFSVIFVVLIHSFNSWPRYLTPISFSEDWYNAGSYIQMFVSNGLARFVIPALFMISGYLLFLPKQEENKFPYWKKISKRFRTLFLPFVFWNLIVIGLLFGLTRIPFFSNTIPWWLNFDFQRLWVNFFSNPYNYPIWYLRDLFLFVLFSPVFYLAFKKVWSSLIILAALAVFYMGELNPGNLIFLPGASVFISAEGLFFFALGGFFTRFSLRISQKKLAECKPNPWAFPLMFLAFILLASKTNLAFTLEENLEPLYLWMLMMYKGTQVLLLISIWLTYDWFFPPDQPAAMRQKSYSISQAGFLIFVIHAPLINVLSESFALPLGHTEAPGSPWWGLVLYFGLPLILIGFGIAVDYLLRRLAPPIHFWLTGGR